MSISTRRHSNNSFSRSDYSACRAGAGVDGGFSQEPCIPPVSSAGPWWRISRKRLPHSATPAHSIAVSSGTDALRFALMAAGVNTGDVVVTVPHTFIATTEAISQAGALPEFVDIDERTYNLDRRKTARLSGDAVHGRDKSGKLISRRSGRPVTAIVPVHLYGQMADMDAILALAEKYRLIVVEDACQAHGAEYFSQEAEPLDEGRLDGTRRGFQFLSRKKSGRMRRSRRGYDQRRRTGRRKCKMMRDHGQAKKYYHDMEGYNGRLDAIQAGILHVKLIHLRQWNAERRKHAAEYNRLLASDGQCRNAALRAVLVARGLSPICGPRTPTAKA